VKVQQARAAAAARAEAPSCNIHHAGQRHSESYSSKEGLEWLLQVAEALDYLHSTAGGKPKVIHR
jgi:serine/threonine protein kinase